ncbi:MAG: GNAT family N-acetyltransferase [Dehalococcoidales bacterium]|nr:MAG: GNAT family N-acetyltransferase [Dehalococcoidales bacterium]
MNITVKLLEAQDIQLISLAFTRIGWNKPVSLLEGYLAEQERGERVVLVAYSGDAVTGYVTVIWKSYYPPFVDKGIPEINDLNVLPDFRRRGIASALLDEAEKKIFERSPVAGIGVGMHAGYGAAQRMYAIRGYVPDGLGISYQGVTVEPGQQVPVDDDLILYLVKERNQP